MPLIQGFRSTTVWKAFALNSLAASLIIFIAITVKSKLDKYDNKDGGEVQRTTNFKSVILTLLSTFIASFVAYTTLYFIFGFGGAMTVNE